MSYAPTTRPSLLLRVRDVGDVEAWREFVRLYTPLVFRHCIGRGLQEADAADVAQEVMRIAARAMPEFQYDSARGKFRGWLLQTTRNRLCKFFEQQQRVPQSASETAVGHFLENEAVAGEEVRWEEEYRQHVFGWALDKARSEFESTTWEAFRLTALEAISVKETAAKLGISPGAIYIARSRVTARLRELIATVSDEPVDHLEA